MFRLHMGVWSRSHGIATVLLAVLMISMSVPATAAKSADPYLSAINAEGNRLESLGKARQEEEALLREERKSASAPANTSRSKVATAANQQQFEDALRQSFPGSYALYSLMDTGERGEVFAEYNKKNVDGPARFIPVVKKIIAITSASSGNRARALNK